MSDRRTRREARGISWAAGVGLLVAVFVVYLPYRNNPLIFDDFNLFTEGPFFVAAVRPWEIGPRALPYFTLAFVETLFGQMWVHRVLSCALHALCAYCVYVLVRELLEDAAPNPASPYSGALVAFTAASAFAVHPVAVYAAGYLIQRSIVLATLFSLLGLIALRRSLILGDRTMTLAAVLMYALAVLSKEQAFLLPAAACALALLIHRTRGVAVLKHTALFVALCAPVALLVLILRSEYVAVAYEPNFARMQAERFGLPAFASGSARWLASAGIQAQLFFHYASLWFWPDTSQMSVDLRIDFSDAASPRTALVGLVAFAATGIAAAAALLSGGRTLAVAGWAVAYAWIMFAVELASIRFQEPFVLYRSYLWAPAYAVVLALFLQRLPVKMTLLLAAAIVPLLTLLAYNRLDTFQSAFRLWDDAAAALPRAEIAGARRIFFLRGRELYLAGRYEEALRDADMAVHLAPGNARMRMARGSTLLALGRVRDAASDFEAAIAMDPEEQRAHLLLAAAFEQLGEPARAEATVRAAEALGHRGFVKWLHDLRDGRNRPKPELQQ